MPGEIKIKHSTYCVVLNHLGTYEKSMEKLILAQDTSNVDNSDMSSEEIKERDKKRRHLKAKRKLSSSSEDEELMPAANKENQVQNKRLPNFPKIQTYVSNTVKEKITQPTENLAYEENIFTNSVSFLKKVLLFINVIFITTNKCFSSFQTKMSGSLYKRILLKKILLPVVS